MIQSVWQILNWRKFLTDEGGKCFIWRRTMLYTRPAVYIAILVLLTTRPARLTHALICLYTRPAGLSVAQMDTSQIGDRPYRWQLHRWHIRSVTSQFGDSITRWQVISVTGFNSNVKCSHRPIVYDSSAVPGTCR